MINTGYAKEVIVGRWKEAEPLIAKSSEAALEYSDMIGRFPSGEAAISKNKVLAKAYKELFK